MNYIKQIRFLWSKAKRHSLGAGEIAMYFYLLETSNVHDWENPVMEPNTTLQHAIRVKSFNTLKEIRNRLQQFGLLRFQTRNGSSVVEYDLYDVETQTFSKFDKVTAKVTDEVAAKVTDEVGVSVLLINKQKQKPKQKDGEKPPAHERKIFGIEYFKAMGYDFSNFEQALIDSVDDFLRYRSRHELHGGIRSPDQVEQIFKTILTRNISVDDFKKMVEFTKERGAKNIIYELPKKENGTDKKQSVSQPWRQQPQG